MLLKRFIQPLTAFPREIIRLCALATDYLLQVEGNMINIEVVREVLNPNG